MIVKINFILVLLIASGVGAQAVETKKPAVVETKKPTAVVNKVDTAALDVSNVPMIVKEDVFEVAALTDSLINAKLDSISKIFENKFEPQKRTEQEIADSVQKLRNDVAEGKYIARTNYDKSNFDHWKYDSLLQERKKAEVSGEWHTRVIPHGHAFRDAALNFAKNDTLYSSTYTYADSGRYHQTGDYAYLARYRFDSDSTFRSREVFLERNVVRWDYVQLKTRGDSLQHHLYKLEFRDLMDNWLDAIQEFERIPPEKYLRGKREPPASKLKHRG